MTRVPSLPRPFCSTRIRSAWRRLAPLPGGKWRRLVDTQSFFDTSGYLNSNMKSLRRSQNVSLESPVPLATADYGVVGRSIVVLEQF